METKICSKCKQEKPLEEFNKSSTSADGLQYVCKECMAVYNKQRSEEKKKKKDVIIQNDHTLKKVYSNPELAKFHPRELIAELKARGYSGELRYTQVFAV